MLYSGTFSCGHEGKVNIIGKAKDREWKIERAFSNMCPDCYKKWLEEEHQRKNKEAMEEAKEMDLPELTGTEKQIAWANTLRKKFVDTVEDRIESLKTKNAPKKTKRYQETLDHILLTKTEAKYYIDNRYQLVEDVIDSFKEEYKKGFQEDIEEQEVLIEDTIRQKDSKPGFVEILSTKDKIICEYEKNEEFRTLVKSLGYKWNNQWERTITETNGPIEDRIAELGNKLLNAGFAVCIHSKELREKAGKADYEPECTRWIKLVEESFYITWSEHSDSLYAAAKKLPGAKWHNRGMWVKLSYYSEVEDFAEQLGFKFTTKALRYKEDYKQQFNNTEIVIPEKSKQKQEKNGLQDILNSSTDILDDLKECD